MPSRPTPLDGMFTRPGSPAREIETALHEAWDALGQAELLVADALQKHGGAERLPKTMRRIIDAQIEVRAALDALIGE